MKDSELQALISLLEDEDPGVKTHVEEQLLVMGATIIPRLEQVWETTEDDFLQARIEDMIHLIQSKAVISNLREWRSAGGGDLLEGWFFVTQYQFPELDIAHFRNGINRLVNRIWLELRNGMTIPEKLVVVNRMLFAKENYRPNRKNLNKVQNYFINGVFETKKGG
ncbi:MAG: transglutaminase family protein, partial [Bacteroidota bacterium]